MQLAVGGRTLGERAGFDHCDPRQECVVERVRRCVRPGVLRVVIVLIHLINVTPALRPAKPLCATFALRGIIVVGGRWLCYRTRC